MSHIHKTLPKQDNAQSPTPQEAVKHDTQSTSDLLDEIDSVLEVEAEAFVKITYKRAGKFGSGP